MDNTQRLSKRTAFEQSLRRSGWDEGSITAQWYKIEAENQMYEIFRVKMDEPFSVLSGIDFLQKYNRVV